MAVRLMRVIAGRAKGRRLKTPPGPGVRPMTDRMREAVFSSLAAEIPGARVLDLYAGTGSLGLEALSRGAAGAVFVERDRSVLEILRSNIDRVGLGGRASGAEAGRFLAGASARDSYDLVFLDPPYRTPDDRVGEELAAAGRLLSPGGAAVVHRRAGGEALRAEGLTLEDDRNYGSARVLRYRRRTGR